MMGNISMAEVAATHGGTLMMPDFRLSGLSIDSRTLQAHDAFVAIRGTRVDGHQFADQAVASGAGALIVERPLRHLSTPQWVVENSTLALGQIAREVRRASAAAVVGITGSTGKTTVKTLVASIASGSGPVLATQGNLNNELGVPLTLARLAPEHRYAVIEMGAARLGDISYLADMVMPDVALVNNIGVAHLERFGSRGNIVRAKGEIYESLGAAGIAVINLDSEGADYFCSIAGANQLHFSMRADCGADLWCEALELAPTSSRFRICAARGEVEVCLPLLGRANVENALAAAGVGLALGLELAAIGRGLAAVQPVPGRLTPRPGLHGALVLDDSYNANPVSVRAAIDAMRQFPGRSVLVLGNMGELGPDTEQMHAEIGHFARERGVSALLGVGDLAAAACVAFAAGAQHFSNIDELAEFARTEMAQGDVWLVKGSRSAGLDRLVEQIIQGEGRQHASLAD